MDKILLTAFLTALAGFITAALSIVKLVNEKESKTTEFRQAWTQSARAALADLVARINSHAASLASARRVSNGLKETMRAAAKAQTELEKEMLKGLLEHQYEMQHQARTRANDLALEVQQAYATARLHFKINDAEFIKVEHKFDVYESKISQIKAEEDADQWDVLKEQIFNATLEMTVISRGLLKSEWEKVKLGEPAYQYTKKWSVWSCAAMLAILLAIAVHAFLYSKSFSVQSAAPSGAAIEQEKKSLQ